MLVRSVFVFFGPDFRARERLLEVIINDDTLLRDSMVLISCNISFNHKNYNFLDCDWFKKLLFSTNSLAKLLSDSLLLDSLLLDSSISQSHSKL